MARRANPVPLAFDPFSYRRRASARMMAGDVAVGLGEVPRVVVRRATLDKIAHRLAGMGDFQPEIVYEQADVREIDPRDAEAVHALNAEAGNSPRDGARRPRTCRSSPRTDSWPRAWTSGIPCCSRIL